MKLDILAFSAHPDDIELCCSGTLIKHIAMGKKVGIVDLTRGELGTRGTAEIREQEAAEATRIMGLHVRENLGMRDGFFRNDEEHQFAVIRMIRKYQPEIILANAIRDRHPDHGRAAELVRTAGFLSGLIKIQTEDHDVAQNPWRAKAMYHYIQDELIDPDLIIDVSDFNEKKMECIRAFRSQFFDPNSSEPETYISSPDFLNMIIRRAQEFGRFIGVKYAEGFTSRRKIGLDNFMQLI